MRVVASGMRGRLGAGGDAQLGEDVGDVVLCGLAGDEQLRRDLDVGATGGVTRDVALQQGDTNDI